MTISISQDEIKAINFILEIAEDHDDRGPAGFGWQSEELMAATGLVRDFVERLRGLE
jgi:hypothetical protein